MSLHPAPLSSTESSSSTLLRRQITHLRATRAVGSDVKRPRPQPLNCRTEPWTRSIWRGLTQTGVVILPYPAKRLYLTLAPRRCPYPSSHADLIPRKDNIRQPSSRGHLRLTWPIEPAFLEKGRKSKVPLAQWSIPVVLGSSRCTYKHLVDPVERVFGSDRIEPLQL